MFGGDRGIEGRMRASEDSVMVIDLGQAGDSSREGSIGMQVGRDPGQLARAPAGDRGGGEWLIEPFTQGSAVTCGVLQRDGALMTLPPLETVLTAAEFLTTPPSAIPQATA